MYEGIWIPFVTFAIGAFLGWLFIRLTLITPELNENQAYFMYAVGMVVGGLFGIILPYALVYSMIAL